MCSMKVGDTTSTIDPLRLVAGLDLRQPSPKRPDAEVAHLGASLRRKRHEFLGYVQTPDREAV
jgi:hypothetical protein